MVKFSEMPRTLYNRKYKQEWLTMYSFFSGHFYNRYVYNDVKYITFRGLNLDDSCILPKDKSGKIKYDPDDLIVVTYISEKEHDTNNNPKPEEIVRNIEYMSKTEAEELYAYLISCKWVIGYSF